MALDAFVYCDCFERDNLRCDPPRGLKLRVSPNGDLLCEPPDDSAWHAFNAWKLAKACLHEGMILVRHRLGSPKAIEVIRTELQRDALRFPILLEKVVYSGTHTCDWLPLSCLPRLTQELKHVNPDPAHTPAADAVRLFKIQIAELIIAAQLARKPICF
jgi:hypothetical protein